MAKKKKTLHAWSAFDDTQLADLKAITSAISSNKFSLELLVAGWNLMPDDFEKQAEQLREVHASLGELVKELEARRDECDE